MSEQYQKEIEEILKKAEIDGPTPVRPRRPSFLRLLWLQVRQSLGGKTWSLSPGRLMLAAGLLILAWIALRPAIPGLAGYLAWAGLLVFIVGYAMFFVRSPKDPQKRWRGQPLDDRPNGPAESWWDRIRRRMR